MDLNSKTTPELLQLYNQYADLMDRPQVKRFSDRSSAIKRTAAIIEAAKAVGGAAPKEEQQARVIAGETVISATNDESMESDMAKKATKTKKASNGKKPDSKAAAKADPEGSKSVVRSGSNRETVINLLSKSPGKMVPIGTLMKAVYGNSADVNQKSAINMVLVGIKELCSLGRVPFMLKRERIDKEVHVGFFKS